MSELRDIRSEKKLTQKEAADLMGVSLRSYISYENDFVKEDTPKYRFMLHELQSINPLDEEHGILSLDEIKEICSQILPEYEVDYCYLFGSYAKGKAQGTSDVDLLVATPVTGLKYYELVESLREALHKKVDLLDLRQVLNNEKLLNEILKVGIRIYG